MEEPQTVPVVSFKKRAVKTKSTIRKREATPPRSSFESDLTSSEDEEGRQIKRRRKNVGLTAASSTTRPSTTLEPNLTPSAAPTSVASNKDDATRSSTWYDEPSRSKPSEKANTASEPAYILPTKQTFIATNPNKPSIGPTKQSSNVRTITTTDFAPDVCKDYKQTGFCGFGDNCKYLHAREDYKQGWQIDRDWEIRTKNKPQTGKVHSSANRNNTVTGEGNDDDDDEKLLESIPFKCIICKDSYKSPIVTKCGHYFCEACALKRYRKDPSCAACGAGTGGVFNVAKKLNRLLERKTEREERKRREQEEQELGDAS